MYHSRNLANKKYGAPIPFWMPEFESRQHLKSPKLASCHINKNKEFSLVKTLQMIPFVTCFNSKHMGDFNNSVEGANNYLDFQ